MTAEINNTSKSSTARFPWGQLRESWAVDAGRPTAEWPSGRPVITTMPEPYSSWVVEIITAT